MTKEKKNKPKNKKKKDIALIILLHSFQRDDHQPEIWMQTFLK